GRPRDGAGRIALHHGRHEGAHLARDVQDEMIKTYGLTHVAVAVRDVTRASQFYRQVFGAVEVYKNDGFVQLQTPGARDVLVFEEKPTRAGKIGGVSHFGFRLKDPKDIDAAATEVKKAGGTIKEQGEFVPG